MFWLNFQNATKASFLSINERSLLPAGAAYVSYCATIINSKSVFLCSNGSRDKWVSNLSFLNVCISVSCLDGEDLTSFCGVQCLFMYYHVLSVSCS